MVTNISHIEYRYIHIDSMHPNGCFLDDLQWELVSWREALDIGTLPQIKSRIG